MGGATRADESSHLTVYALVAMRCASTCRFILRMGHEWTAASCEARTHVRSMIAYHYIRRAAPGLVTALGKKSMRVAVRHSSVSRCLIAARS